MLRELLLLRHAEAESKVTDRKDYDRELTEKGRAQCLSVAQQMAKENIRPEFVVSSAAVRARSTCDIVLAHLQLESPTQFDRDLYEIEEPALLEYVRHFDDKYKRIMLAGHNPAFSNLLFMLARGVGSGLGTCDLAIIQCSSKTWKEIGPHNTSLQKIVHA